MAATVVKDRPSRFRPACDAAARCVHQSASASAACTAAGHPSRDQRMSTDVRSDQPEPGSRRPHVTRLDQPRAGSPLLLLRGVSKNFGAVHALADVDLDIPAGQVTALDRRQRRRQVGADQVHRRDPHPRLGRDPLGRPPGPHPDAPRRRRARHRDGPPGPRPVRQPRHRPEHVPRPRETRHALRARRGRRWRRPPARR